MYINYQPNRSGIVYASATTSKRVGRRIVKDKDESIYLGRVLDRERLIFKNKIDGIFQFDLRTGKKFPAPSDFVPNIVRKNAKQPELLLNFGDVYFVDRFQRDAHISPLIKAIDYGNPDSLKALLSFYILSKKANRHAQNWWDGSYARLLYPLANLTSQRISEMLATIGSELTYQRFFKAYIPYVIAVSEAWGYTLSMDNVGPSSKEEDEDVPEGEGILIDSTGLPNAVRIPLTAISNHNGEISEEIRLIYVVQRGTGLPLYMRYVPGNVIDSTTLITTLHELKANGIDTKFAIMDAGYVTLSNLKELKTAKISFLARLPENRSVFKSVWKEHGNTLMDEKNMVRYKSRLLYMKRVKASIADEIEGYVYLSMDTAMRSVQINKLMQRAASDNLSINEVKAETRQLGVFCLISSRRIATEKVLPLYYTRQNIEQVFDLAKNYSSMLPLCVQTEETLRGHLLLTFLSTVIIRQIQQMGKKEDMDLEEIFECLANQKCKVYPNTVIPQEVTRKQREIYEAFKIPVPKTLAISGSSL